MRKHSVFMTISAPIHFTNGESTPLFLRQIKNDMRPNFFSHWTIKPWTIFWILRSANPCTNLTLHTDAGDFRDLLRCIIENLL